MWYQLAAGVVCENSVARADKIHATQRALVVDVVVHLHESRVNHVVAFYVRGQRPCAVDRKHTLEASRGLPTHRLTGRRVEARELRTECCDPHWIVDWVRRMRGIHGITGIDQTHFCACASGRCREYVLGGISHRVTLLLIVQKEEKLVFFDGSAKGRAELL